MRIAVTVKTLIIRNYANVYYCSPLKVSVDVNFLINLNLSSVRFSALIVKNYCGDSEFDVIPICYIYIYIENRPYITPNQRPILAGKRPNNDQLRPQSRGLIIYLIAIYYVIGVVERDK